jgi:phosphoglucosamine mutase
VALFGTSGIRQLADRSLFELALKVGFAVGQIYPRVVVGWDTRTSSEALMHSVLGGLLASGSKPFLAGLVPTPTLAVSGRDFDAALMITASHNPPEYNGIKLLNPDGSAFSLDQQKELERIIRDDLLRAANWNDIQGQDYCPHTITRHISHIREFFPGRYPLKVVLDCAGAAACVITPILLEKMGCEVIRLNCEPVGRFPHPVEPVVENLSELISAVTAFGADLGIAHDGDADRMMAVDGSGRFISGDKMLRLMAEELEAKNLVTTIDASMAIEKTGYFVMRTAVGDNNVCEELKKNNYHFGGEPSGAWIFPRSSLCPDGIFAAALVISIAAKEKLAALVDRLPDFPIYRSSLPADGIDFHRLAETLASKTKPVSISRIDGLKFVFDDAWFLIRPSGTEPKVRITVEATSRQKLDDLKHLLISLMANRP